MKGDHFCCLLLHFIFIAIKIMINCSTYKDKPIQLQSKEFDSIILYSPITSSSDNDFKNQNLKSCGPHVDMLMLAN